MNHGGNVAGCHGDGNRIAGEKDPVYGQWSGRIKSDLSRGCHDDLDIGRPGKSRGKHASG